MLRRIAAGLGHVRRRLPPLDAAPIRRARDGNSWRDRRRSGAGGTRATRHRPRAPARNRSRLSFDFAPRPPDAGLFPLKTWRRLLQTCLSQGGAPGLAQPGDLFGLASLRSAIANHLAAARGIVAEPGQIVIVSGTRRGDRHRHAPVRLARRAGLRRGPLLPARRRRVPRPPAPNLRACRWTRPGSSPTTFRHVPPRCCM